VADLENWMAKHPDVTLGNMHLPGAHDAGTAKHLINKTIAGTESNSGTQTLSVLNQVKAGTRLFDIRLQKVKSGGLFKPKSTKVVAYHKTFGQGATSKETFDATLGAVSDWWENGHTTEVLIFRISHTEADTRIDDLIKQSVSPAALHTGTGNLCKKTLKDIAKAGGIICILDDGKLGNMVDQANGLHRFKKYSGAGIDDGIAVCGQYKTTHKLSEVITTGLSASYEHNTNHNPTQGDHLWHLYWQKTYTNPFKFGGIKAGTTKGKAKGGTYSQDDKKIHGGTHAATEHMIKLMKGHARATKKGTVMQDDYAVGKDQDGGKIMFSTLSARNLMLPNIISYDFVNAKINKQIIALNDPNGMQHGQDGEEI
jgi:hypothetical protein